MKYKAVVFDLDGTLVDSLEDIINAFSTVLKDMGFPLPDRKIIKDAIGDKLETRVRIAIPEECWNEKVFPEFRDRFKLELKKRCTETTRPYEGVMEMLAELKKRGYKVGILTNKRDEVARQVIAELLKGFEFDSVRGMIPGMPEKPDPAAANLMADNLGVTAKDIIYVGDTIFDIQTAVNAGMLPVGVSWGVHSADMLKASGAEIVLEHPADLLKVAE
jgi:phosphoglycolate phosphatase